jgi:hypothetical protein
MRFVDSARKDWYDVNVSLIITFLSNCYNHRLLSWETGLFVLNHDMSPGPTLQGIRLVHNPRTL